MEDVCKVPGRRRMVVGRARLGKNKARGCESPERGRSEVVADESPWKGTWALW